ncbi:hypothetical protein FV219_03040 [Methylobacterium sp. WL122]|nr:hypothetical protein FV219_03040 [Methylobacterium sp. WL122]
MKNLWKMKYKKPKEHLKDLPADFEERVYFDLHPDVAESGQTAAEHYLRHGRIEQRPYKITENTLTKIPGDFDEQTYLDLNPDVVSFSGFPRDHYLQFGYREGRKYKTENSLHGFTDITVSYRSYPTVATSEKAVYFGNTPVNPKIVAFYLPQYHQIRENDEWWGHGFTEWTNVKKARPNFVGHTQPHVPLGNDYYDLADKEVQEKQNILAKTYGIHAFCYYMYWFNGRRVLEKPLDQMLDNKNIDNEFCICWANENWTRTWDGKEKDILLRQVHSAESDRQFIRDAMKYLADKRYMRVDGKLMLLVYRVDLIPNCQQTAAIWRDEVREAGLGELHLCAVQFYGVTDPTPWGFDAAVEFPPHGWLEQSNLPDNPHKITNKNFEGYIFDYNKSIDHALRKPIPNYTWYRGAFPGWDNTARRQNTSHIFADSNPEAFEKWLLEILNQQVIMSEPQNQIVFINAWNEWGEGAHLEPDERLEYLNLQAVNSALTKVKQEAEILNVLNRLRSHESYPTRTEDEAFLLRTIRGYNKAISHLQNELASTK